MKTGAPLYLPWKYEYGEITSSAHLDLLHDVCRVREPLGQFIVLSVNHFDAMKEALQEAQYLAAHGIGAMMTHDKENVERNIGEARRIQEKIRAVLDAIEKEQRK